MTERAYADVEEKIHTISGITWRYPQDSYAVVVRIIQSEWIFLRCVTLEKGMSECELIYRFVDK